MNDINGNRWAHFITSTKGALFALGAAVALGAVAALWLAGLTSLPEDVDKLRVEISDLRGEVSTVGRHNTVQDSALSTLTRRDTWIICTTVPPNRRDVLQALDVRCNFSILEGQDSEPIPR